MKRIKINFQTTIYYDQYHDVSDEDYEILKKYDGEDIPDILKQNDSTVITHPAHDIISDIIDYDSVHFDNDFENFEIEAAD